MSVARTVDTRTSRKTNHDYNNVTAILPDHDGRVDTEFADRVLRLTGVLQTTLDVHQMIKVFIKEISSFLAPDSAHYSFPEQRISVNSGKPQRHRCNYQLSAGDQGLGHLTLTRRRRFSAADTEILEKLLCCLVYPLRNGLLYRKALQAALTDPLTGVQNRTAMDAAVTHEIELALRHKTPPALIIIDIDHFKKINDNYGHPCGDSVIRNIANTINRSIRRSDRLFRLGGEEFAVLLHNTCEEGATHLAHRILNDIGHTPITCDSHVIHLTASLGVAAFRSGDNVTTLYRNADNALYQAKHSGRSCVRVYRDV